MITDAILNIVTAPIGFILNLLPVFDFGLADKFAGFNNWITDIFNAVHYFLPLKNLLLIFGLSLAVTNARTIFSLIKKAYEMIPGI